jgi:hypothetical protein
LFSRFGTGGQLTESGVLDAAEAMNIKRDVMRRVNVVLESGEAALLTEFIEMLYRRATAPRNNGNNSVSGGHGLPAAAGRCISASGLPHSILKERATNQAVGKQPPPCSSTSDVLQKEPHA